MPKRRAAQFLYTTRPIGAAIAAIACVSLAGCGGSSAPSDQHVALCLSDALFDSQLPGLQNYCDSTMSIRSLSIACTHQSGNQYVCVATGSPAKYDGAYNVTDDGHTFAYVES